LKLYGNGTQPLEIGTVAGWAPTDTGCEAPNCCCDNTTGCEVEGKV